MREITLVERVKGGYWIYSAGGVNIGTVEEDGYGGWIATTVLSDGTPGGCGATPEAAIKNDLEKAYKSSINMPTDDPEIFDCKHGRFYFDDVISTRREEWDGEKLYHFRVKKVYLWVGGEWVNAKTNLALDENEYKSYLHKKSQRNRT
jgi:hypothetical protein